MCIRDRFEIDPIDASGELNRLTQRLAGLNIKELRLRAEMKVPGHAWLEWRVSQSQTGCLVEQKAVFVPRGLWGRCYWLALVPAHAVIFKRMLKAVVREAER